MCQLLSSPPFFNLNPTQKKSNKFYSSWTDFSFHFFFFPLPCPLDWVAVFFPTPSILFSPVDWHETYVARKHGTLRYPPVPAPDSGTNHSTTAAAGTKWKCNEHITRSSGSATLSTSSSSRFFGLGLDFSRLPVWVYPLDGLEGKKSREKSISFSLVWRVGCVVGGAWVRKKWKTQKERTLKFMLRYFFRNGLRRGSWSKTNESIYMEFRRKVWPCCKVQFSGVNTYDKFKMMSCLLALKCLGSNT